MASPLLQGKLHISGMDSRAAALARQWQLGLETIAFSYAPLLDDSAALPRARENTRYQQSVAPLPPLRADPAPRRWPGRSHARFRQDWTQRRRWVYDAWYSTEALFPMSTFRSGMWSSRCGSGGNSCGTYRPT